MRLEGAVGGYKLDIARSAGAAVNNVTREAPLHDISGIELRGVVTVVPCGSLVDPRWVDLVRLVYRSGYPYLDPQASRLFIQHTRLILYSFFKTHSIIYIYIYQLPTSYM